MSGSIGDFGVAFADGASNRHLLNVFWMLGKKVNFLLSSFSFFFAMLGRV